MNYLDVLYYFLGLGMGAFVYRWGLRTGHKLGAEDGANKEALKWSNAWQKVITDSMIENGHLKPGEYWKEAKEKQSQTTML